MAGNICPQCGAPLDPGALECKFCGEKIAAPQQNAYVQQPQNAYAQQPQNTYAQQPVYAQPQPQTVYVQPQPVFVTGINPTWPIKSKVVAGILAILLGSLGIHKFYLGKIGMGIIYLLFCWTGIPGIVGLIEGIIYLCSNDENFQLKHHVRIG